MAILHFQRIPNHMQGKMYLLNSSLNGGAKYIPPGHLLSKVSTYKIMCYYQKLGHAQINPEQIPSWNMLDESPAEWTVY